MEHPWPGQPADLGWGLVLGIGWSDRLSVLACSDAVMQLWCYGLHMPPAACSPLRACLAACREGHYDVLALVCAFESKLGEADD